MVGMATFDPTREQIRENLIRFREAVGLSQSKAASMAGTSVYNLVRYEKGESFPDAVTLKRLGDVYGHKVDDFYEPDPPDADLDGRPVFFLQVREDAPPEVLQAAYAELRKALDKANADVAAAVAARHKTKKKRS